VSGIGSITDEAALRAFVQRVNDQSPQAAAVRQLQGATAGWSPTWLAPTFSAGWGSYDARHPVRYAVSPWGECRLKGLAKKSALPAAYETMFTLPVRPGQELAFHALYGEQRYGAVFAQASGAVWVGLIPAGFTAADWVSLDGISFWAEA
jgi:hypothetical protein